jgi:hypothetical protein
LTRSRSRRIPREPSRHHPTPPRSPATSSRTHTSKKPESRQSVMQM